ncbi:hypothetical protein EV401DRAFT_2084644 [Pisolithus croceorrhizus]|nr:hypothetical protein EV401DRAFT_2084644 [Pisolithus croceorrhizus]
MAEIDTHVQEEVTKLSSTLQAEKERELANIKQHYAWLRKPTPQQDCLPSHPQASTLSTPNLDAIKQIRKGQGISKQTWLIGVEMDDNGLNHKSTLPKGCKETGGGATPGTQDDQLNLPPVTAVVEAVTKSVKTALRTLLESGGHFQLALFHRVQGKLHGKEGEHGMSSEESSVENGIENVLQVKKMEWQKNIDKELEIIDLQQILNKDIFCLQGAKPLPRKHAPDNPTSSQAPVTALPMALCNEEWILQLTEHQRGSLKISKEPFPWMKIIAT